MCTYQSICRRQSNNMRCTASYQNTCIPRRLQKSSTLLIIQRRSTQLFKTRIFLEIFTALVEAVGRIVNTETSEVSLMKKNINRAYFFKWSAYLSHNAQSGASVPQRVRIDPAHMLSSSSFGFSVLFREFVRECGRARCQ